MAKAVRPPLDHLLALSDDTGIIQHAILDVPNRSTGYCTDDVSRAFMMVLQRLRGEPTNATLKRLAGTYLAFLCDAQMEDGWFHNFMSYGREWLDERGTQDSFGRALWSLGYGMRFARRKPWRGVCTRMLDAALPRIGELEYIRSKAYAILGLWHALKSPSLSLPLDKLGVTQNKLSVTQSDDAPSARSFDKLRVTQSDKLRVTRGVTQPHNAYLDSMRPLGSDLRAAYERHRTDDWHWFEDVMTYDNPRLCEASIYAGEAFGDERLVEIGLESLRFYINTGMENGIFVPIGNEGWYERGGQRARFGQQPLEAVAMIDGGLAAYERSNDPLFLSAARAAWLWYYGQNTAGTTIVEDGGCHDGIDQNAVNPNMGAESTLAYLSAAATMSEAENAFTANVNAQ
ncbi:MAG: hypothetical protein JO135_01850 [Candidatus Eremiobacteraeota bacterium]|nr:hypothetical protein [Candidatus Eremiobacteraeota bacterium]